MGFETALTVGEVAGILGGALTFVQVALPLLLAVILVGLLNKNSYNAATWGAIAYTVQSSVLPQLLCTVPGNGIRTRFIQWRVSILSTIGFITTMALVPASILLPTPLGEKMVPSRALYSNAFEYAPDTTLYGLGTPARPRDRITRTCGWDQFVDCPFSDYQRNTSKRATSDDLPPHFEFNSSVPAQVLAPYYAANWGSTVASPTDIEYRNWFLRHNEYIDKSKAETIGYFQSLATFILDPKYHIVEGLVVDSVNGGGIGLRNHSVPAGLDLGGQWEEDLLWITPITECTDTNLTLHFTISQYNTITEVNGFIRDEGGFSNLSPVIPEVNWQDYEFEPDLQYRSYAAAWWNNQFVARALGDLSASPQPGETFWNQTDYYTNITSATALKITELDGKFLDAILSGVGSTSNGTDDFDNFAAKCRGYDDLDWSSSTKAFIRCGYLYGLPYPSFEASGQPRRLDPGSSWTQNLYVCTSAAKASIKRVRFAKSSKAGLEGLSVVQVTPKSYEDSRLPLWGIEKVEPYKYKILDIDLLWGLVGDSFERHPNLTTRRAESIYLPAANTVRLPEGIYDFNAPGNALNTAWNAVYDRAAIIEGTSIGNIPSYSGSANYALSVKWRELSRSATGAAKAINLIWTDLAAFAVVGTNTGFLEETGPGSQILGHRPVHRLVRNITYSSPGYAIPAIIATALFIFAVLACVYMCFSGAVGWRKLNHISRQTGMARAVSQIQNPNYAVSTQTTDEWVQRAGNFVLMVPGLSYNGMAMPAEKSYVIIGREPKRDNGEDWEMMNQASAMAKADNSHINLERPMPSESLERAIEQSREGLLYRSTT